MSVVVTKSLPVVVRPSSEPPASNGISHINLSSFDESYSCLPVMLVMVFDHPMEDPVETVKRALSQALVHYGAIAGRLTDDNRIACTGEGVTFVGASASCPLSLLPTLPITDLVLHYPEEMCRHSDPFVLMQVTHFSCGGFTVAVTCNHVIGDGKGMAQFWQAVGELARGMPEPSVRPVRSCDQGLLPTLPASEVVMRRSLMKIATKDMVPLDVTLPWSFISRIKAQYGCTMFDAVAAVLWQCRTRAAIADPKAAVSLSFPCELRKHLGVEDGYYGNCFTTTQVHATAGSVANGELGDLVNLIKRGKESVLLKLSNGEVKDEGRSRPTMDQIKNQLYNIISVGSWRNLGLDAIDFGHGTPSRLMWHKEQVVVPSCVICPPCKGNNEVYVTSLLVKAEHADIFLAELASM